MWTKLDDSFPDHPKLMKVGMIGELLQIRAFCWVGKYLTDAHLPETVADELVHQVGVRVGKALEPAEWKAAMVEARLWDRCAGGYQVHGYLERNPSKKQVVVERQKGAKRLARWRAEQRRKKRHV